MGFRDSTESVAPPERDGLLKAKAVALFDLACEVQDRLGALGIFYGDEPLLQAKQRIDAACTAARTVASRIRHNEKARARALKAIALREA